VEGASVVVVGDTSVIGDRDALTPADRTVRVSGEHIEQEAALRLVLCLVHVHLHGGKDVNEVNEVSGIDGTKCRRLVSH
jgi:hypothetical protein